MKKKVRFLMSVAGTGDPSPAQLQHKYDQHLRGLTANNVAAMAAGKPGKSDDELQAIVDAGKRKDAKIPRVSGFTHEFSFKPNDVAMIPADIADKWEEAGICIIEDVQKKAT